MKQDLGRNLTVGTVRDKRAGAAVVLLIGLAAIVTLKRRKRCWSSSGHE
jgi:hypothetical protein